MMLLAEDLLLLCVDDDSGQCIIDKESMDRALALALVFEMTILGITALDAETKKVRRTPGPDVSDPLLALCADTVDGYEVVKGVQSLRNTQPRKAIAARLVARGVLREEGMWSRTRHPQQNAQPEIALRARLRGVILEGQEPSEHDLALVAVINNLQIAPGLLPHENAEHVSSMTRRVAQGWAQAEVMEHPGTYKDKRSRFDNGLDLLDSLLSPLNLLDGF